MADLQTSVFSIMGNNSTLSSIIGLVKYHIINKFPKDYFKYTYIKNSFVSVSESGINDEESMVKERPSLSINMVLDYQEANFSGDSHMNCKVFIRKNAYSYPSIYRNIFISEVDRLFISTFEERTKLIFEIGIRLSTEVQAMNVLQFIRGQFGIKRPYYIGDALIEVPIPGSSLNKIIEVKGFDISNPDGINDFHKFLSINSGGRITYKRNLSSGNYLYFYKYNTNILCQIPDMPSIEKNMENKIVNEGIVRFNMEMEFHNHLHYITEYEKLSNEDVYSTLKTIDDDYSTVIYNYTTDMPIQRQRGNKLLAHMVKLVTNVDDVVDETLFCDLLTNNQKTLIQLLLKIEKDDITKVGLFDSIVETLVYRDNLLLNKVDYEIDWHTYKLKIINPLKNYVYALAIYIDDILYNKVFDEYNNISNQYANGNKIKEIL